MWITSSPELIKTPTVVALGNFDGVHRGHRQVIQPIFETDAALQGIPTVATFFPHPREFFSGQPRSLLTPAAEKAAYLEQIGVQQLVLLPFNQALASLTPQEFVETVIVNQLQAQQISVGQDFHFGSRRLGTADDLRAIASNFGIHVEIVPLYTCDGERISSSAIRDALQNGHLERANTLLGRPYTLVGDVIDGQKLGRTIGFPTANLKLPAEKFIPKQGVYAVQVNANGWHNSELWCPGVMNLGFRPTVDGVKLTTEVYVLDWSGDLYGQQLTVRLEAFLRPEQKFSSLDELKAQIQVDCQHARSLLSISQSV